MSKAIVPLTMVLTLVAMACGGSAESPAPAAPAAAPQAAQSAPATSAPAAEYPASAAAQPTPAMAASEGPQTEGFNNIGGSATVNDKPYDLTFFQHYGVNPFIDTEDDQLSTFAIDVDTASYTIARRFLDDGHLPDQNSIRVEEFVNYFDQGYGAPTDDAFAIHVDGSPSPFGNGNHWLMRVGLQGKELLDEQRQDATLVFTIDVSGSMAREDRLGLVKQSLRLLVDELRSDDKVAIVTYGDRGSVLLEATEARERGKILQAIDLAAAGWFDLCRGRPEGRLQAGGGRSALQSHHPRHGALRRRRQRGQHRSRIATAPGPGIC